VEHIEDDDLAVDDLVIDLVKTLGPQRDELTRSRLQAAPGWASAPPPDGGVVIYFGHVHLSGHNPNNN
jgi:hypothetical protein